MSNPNTSKKENEEREPNRSAPLDEPSSWKWRALSSEIRQLDAQLQLGIEQIKRQLDYDRQRATLQEDLDDFLTFLREMNGIKEGSEMWVNVEEKQVKWLENPQEEEEEEEVIQSE